MMMMMCVCVCADSGVTSAPTDPATQGAHKGLGALMPTPMVWLTVNIAGRRAMTMFCSLCRGWGEFFLVTPLCDE